MGLRHLAVSKKSYTSWLRRLETVKRYRPISLVMIVTVIIFSLTICQSILEDLVYSQQLKEASAALLPIHKGVIDGQKLNTARSSITFLLALLIPCKP